ncbi:MAG: hypothetical protein CXR31_04650 [Geobacter sp.]|nr:MAG: hypothetical protein CXR31_04650 [Geobacter sp.]
MTLKTVSPRYIYILIVLVALAVYGNTFRNQWSYDDAPVVVYNPDSHSFAGFLDNSRPGRPLRELTYIPEYKLFGLNPAGYHVQQILWHGGNGILLFTIFCMLGIPPAASLMGALFFLVHPLQVESVANISHRKELLALFFSLTAILTYVKAVAARGGKRIAFLCAALLSYALALLANETAVTLPLLLIVYDVLFLKRGERIIARRPYLLAVVIALAGGAFVYHYRGLFSADQVLKIYSKNGFLDSRGYLPLFFAAFKAFGFYLYKIVCPLQLAPEYVVKFSAAVFQPLAWLAIAVFLLLAGFAVRLRNSAPAVAFGICWFLIFYLPVSNFLPVAYIVADRYMYLCLPGVSLVIAWLFRSAPKPAYWGAGVILLALASLTVIQNGYWRNEHTLWRHAVTVSPDSTWVQETVAASYLMTDELQKAQEHAKKAIELYRYNTRAYFTLAKAEDRLGNLDEAIRNYELFKSFGFMEYPADVANVKTYLPFLRERAQRLRKSEVK